MTAAAHPGARRPDSPPRRRLRRWPLLAAAGAALLASTVAVTQVAYAATLFTANFESGASGWSKSGGTWAVVSDGSQAYRQSNAGSENARVFNGDSGWTNYTVQARVKPVSLGGNGFAAVLARAKTSTTFYRLALLTGNQVQLQAVNSGSVTVLGSLSRTVSAGTWYTLALQVSGSTIRGTVDGTQVGSAGNSLIGNGRIGLQTAYASASFDDVTVSDSGTAPPTGGPTTPPTTPTTPPTSPGNPPSGAWPTPSGSASVSGTIRVSGTFDGGMKRYCCIGDGGQSESQDPMFELAAGATIQNVILGAPAGDGIHCLGNCTIRNVWWEDVGEDAATFLGGSDYYVIGGGARSASDKIFQHNGPGTVHISGFYAENGGKLYRACGNCSSSYQRHVVVDNVTVTSVKVIAGINVNWGDTARFSRITVLNDASHKTVICDKYNGVPKGSEPTRVGSGADGVNCFYSASDITWR
ncbi:pectate lyase [Rhizomonospora bruguierae]|uniref:pectate lyase n=1 Tax=Rhizomonospora bruguierae TaxID=1581705 RepID=UPI001BD0E129|nr:pectate lyase [Micromonospora sp. NBRC 107566]